MDFNLQARLRAVLITRPRRQQSIFLLYMVAGETNGKLENQLVGLALSTANLRRQLKPAVTP
jgi:hypothetical protein